MRERRASAVIVRAGGVTSEPLPRVQPHPLPGLDIAGDSEFAIGPLIDDSGNVVVLIDFDEAATGWTLPGPAIAASPRARFTENTCSQLTPGNSIMAFNAPALVLPLQAMLSGVEWQRCDRPRD